MLVLHDIELHAFKRLEQQKDGSFEFVWRVEEKSEFESCWGAYVDVRATRTYSNVLRYLRKRSMFGTDKGSAENGDLTLALCWLFRKRSFAMSKDLVVALSDLIAHLRISKKQTRLDGGFVKETWVWIGVFSAVELCNYSPVDLTPGSIWSIELIGSPSAFSQKRGGLGDPIWGVPQCF
jgi:hypothetical protein